VNVIQSTWNFAGVTSILSDYGDDVKILNAYKEFLTNAGFICEIVPGYVWIKRAATEEFHGASSRNTIATYITTTYSVVCVTHSGRHMYFDLEDPSALDKAVEFIRGIL